MSFMQKQITHKQAWIKAETTAGTEFLDAVSLGLNLRDSQTKTHILGQKAREQAISQLSDYCEGTILEWETIRGYGARLSAPGYMDCTEWSVFDTVEEAEAYLEEMYGNDDTGNAGCDACGMEDRIEGSNFCADCLPDQK